MTDNIKVGLAVLAATAWGGLAYSGLTPVQDEDCREGKLDQSDPDVTIRK